jgi:hypothetical protein
MPELPSPRVLILLIALSAACGAGEAPAPSAETPADGPLAGYISAAGGRALTEVRTLRAIGVSFDPDDRGNRRLTVETGHPSRYRQREGTIATTGARHRTLIGFDGTTGWWAGNTFLGGEGLSRDPDVRARAVTRAARQNFINFAAGALLWWLPDAGVTVSTLGAISDGPNRGAAAFDLAIDGTPVGRLLLDGETHLPRQLTVEYLTDIRPEGGEYIVSYHDYKDAGGGVLLPYRITRSTSVGGEVQWLVSAYTLNPALPADTFVRPGG